jgi:anaerobic ribonucleoside-triphosphate reductase
MKNSKKLSKDTLGHFEDWRGNNIALSCPVCGKVYVVSGLADQKGRECPNCGKSRGLVDKHGNDAIIEWDTNSSLILKLN